MVELGLVTLHDGENVELRKNCTPERFNDVSNAGFLSLGPTDMVGRTDPLP